MGSAVVCFAWMCAWGLGQVVWPGGTSAQAGLSGSWRAGTTTMDVNVESWGADCGPRPKSSRSQGGGTVTVREDDKHVVIQGKDHVVRTNRCWSRNPSMRRLSSSYVNGQWTTRCKTTADDPREEEGTYVLKRVGPGKLEYRDISRYNWRLKDSSCVATITTIQALEQIGTVDSRTLKPLPEPEPEPEPSAESEEPEPAGCEPGPPARLSLRPPTAELELGGRLCLRAVAHDARGCRLRNPPITYKLSHSPALKGRLERNCFVASESAAEAEGTFSVVASLEALQATSEIHVKSMDLSGLIAMRLETGGVVGFDSEPSEAEPASSARPATRVSTGQAEQAEEDYARLLVVAIGGLAVLGLLIAWWVVRRKQANAVAAATPSVTSIVPAHSAAPAPTVSETTPPPNETWICPNCRHGYPARQRTCPNCPDGANRLIPYAEFNRIASEQQTRLRYCAECGGEVAAQAIFCGHCGSRNLDGV